MIHLLHVCCARGPRFESNCGGVDYTDSVFSVSLKCIGSGRESRFLAHNFLADQSPGVYFGPHIGGTGAHSPNLLSPQIFA